MMARLPFSLGVITDEVSQELDEALAFARHYGLERVELRSVWDKGPFEWTDADVREMAARVRDSGLSVCAISAPLFKCDISDKSAVAAHVAGFARCAAYAKTLSCGIIRGFDGWASCADVARRAELYAPIVELCRDSGVVCALEYDPTCNAKTPARALALVRAIASPHVRVLFDPGNGIFSEPDARPYPDAYELLKDDICHVHIKDAVQDKDGVRAVCVGTGLVDYRRLLARLIRDAYSGCVVLETHYRAAGALADNQLREPGGAAFSRGARAASEESMEALARIIASLAEDSV